MMKSTLSRVRQRPESLDCQASRERLYKRAPRPASARLRRRVVAATSTLAALTLALATATATVSALAPDLATPPPLGEAHHWPLTQVTQLAKRYENGRRPHTAYTLYCLGAARGDAEAAYALGWMYLNGRGVQRDPQRAVNWLQRAADGDIDHARTLLQRLDDTPGRHDDSCPMAGHQRASRKQARRWARALAPHYGLDPALVEAVVSAESAFNSRARSPKDARGLMQLLPATADRFGVSDIYDPVENLRGGMAYLSWLKERFDGDLSLALAAYNAGENAVDRYQGIPPYRETRNYVKRILKQYRDARPRFRAPPADAPAVVKHRHQRLAQMFE